MKVTFFLVVIAHNLINAVSGCFSGTPALGNATSCYGCRDLTLGQSCDRKTTCKTGVESCLTTDTTLKDGTRLFAYTCLPKTWDYDKYKNCTSQSFGDAGKKMASGKVVTKRSNCACKGDNCNVKVTLTSRSATGNAASSNGSASAEPENSSAKQYKPYVLEALYTTSIFILISSFLV